MRVKKKKGSALIIVLVFSIFFVIISSVSVFAVASTFKANAAEERNQTLYYEAEGGVSQVIVKANKGLYDGLTLSDSTRNFSYHEPSTNDHVFVKVVYKEETLGTKVKPYLEVESIAVNKGSAIDNPYTTLKQKRVLKVKVRYLMDNSDLFKYSICGNNVNVTSSGTINAPTTGINSATSVAEITAPTKVPPSDEEHELFALPEFDESKIKRYGGTLTIDAPATEITNILENMLTMEAYKDSIKKVTATNTGGIPGRKFKVFLINADKVKINVMGGAVTFNNGMILTNGDIEITGPLSNTLFMTNSSLVGDSVKASGCSITVYFSPAPNGGVPAFTGFAILEDADVRFIFESLQLGNKGITYYAPNLKFGGGTPPPPNTSVNGKYMGYDYE